ncbi:hypothetical protein [Aneurinibacillus uraniidurans]|uniref:hypothetical protein n=1 Tax=Aneurinibacillus uraniidurans TaxID=2966586 RepID=UPI00234A42C5|nr:hypothetical protein [Aneurinibacillus sp. B1]WCN38483.1 hypothetical protein PO771_03550 [Aneurinibacillus sp. B1]
MSWSVEKANEIFELFKQRAAEDEAFRLLALENPAQAVKELSGMDLPEGIQLSITEDSQGQLQVTTLSSTPTEEKELSEEELLSVSGGTSFSAFILYGPPYDSRKK